MVQESLIVEENGLPPLCSGAVILEGMTKRGKPCRLIDNTASAPREELVALLNDLIEQEHFGPSGLSVAGGNTIRIGAPQSAHVQLGEHIYRMIVVDYSARLESF